MLLSFRQFRDTFRHPHSTSVAWAL